MVGTEDRRADDRRRRHCRGARSSCLTGEQRLLLAALHAEDAVPERRRASRPGRRCASPASRSAASSDVEFAGEQVDVTFERQQGHPATGSPTSRSAMLGSVSLLGESAVDITPSTQRHADSRVGLRAAGHADGADRRRRRTGAAQGIERAHRRWSATSAPGKGTVGKLITDDQLYTELQQFVATAERADARASSRAAARSASC